MFDTKESYQGIFDERGGSYHKAMQRCPHARVKEFELPLSFCRLEPNDVLADIPSGGGYLQSFIPDIKRYVCVESSAVFAEACRKQGNDVCMMNDTHIDLPSQSVDKIVSIAGMHHVIDKKILFSEMHRILRPGGLASIADVHKDSPVEGFLDDIVDKYTSTGHKGIYFSDSTSSTLLHSGFLEVEKHNLDYHWRFRSEREMVNYCKLIFALDASYDDVLAGIQSYLPPLTVEDGVIMPWQLTCFVAQKGK